MKPIYCLSFLIIIVCTCCNKGGSDTPDTPPMSTFFDFKTAAVNGVSNGLVYANVNLLPQIELAFSAKLNTQQTLTTAVQFTNQNGVAVAYTSSYKNDSVILLKPAAALTPLAKFTITINKQLAAASTATLRNAVIVNLTTGIDSTDKFARTTDDSLLTLVQRQTFRYFWDFGHPVSGMARERSNGDNDVVTTGGTGFGIMAMLAAANRQFITRAEALTRITIITTFLQTKCTNYHGAFAHWINGSTGATIPFSTNDNGADLVETSYLMQGLLCARQYFDGATADETALRTNINKLWDAVEWSWFRQGNQNVLYWHWSPDKQWVMNMPISGWNEALIVYALAASSRTSAIPKEVYTQGWARNGSMVNGKTFYNIKLPLGQDYGGPLFFAHYSFLGINPTNLTDAYANYWEQNVAHTQINYTYCVTNAKAFTGYSASCWGLTASDEQGGYNAHSPTNDNGTIAPTAALSSMPYDTAKCMAALRFFYYKLGDKIWGDYGFKDAFNLNNNWYADSYLAIDQGPEIVMIENMRSGLLWKLFMSCPEVKTGMKNIGFAGPNL